MLWKILIGFNCVGLVALCVMSGGDGIGMLPIGIGMMVFLYYVGKKPNKQAERKYPTASYNSRQLDEYTDEFGLIEWEDKK